MIRILRFAGHSLDMACACCDCVEVSLAVCCKRTRAFGGGAVVVDSCEIAVLGTWHTTEANALEFDWIGASSAEYPNGRCNYTFFQPANWPPPWDIYNPNVNADEGACAYRDDGIVYRVVNTNFPASSEACGTWVPSDPFPQSASPVIVCADDWSDYDPNDSPPP